MNLFKEVIVVIYFYLEDIIANAIIELNKIDGSRKIFVCVAKEYAEEVVKKICEKGYYANIKSINERSIMLFEQKYSNFFIPYIELGMKGYSLKEDISIDELLAVFRKESALDIWSTFSDKEIISRILRPYVNLSEKNMSFDISSNRKEVDLGINDYFLKDGATIIDTPSRKTLTKLKSWQKKWNYR